MSIILSVVVTTSIVFAYTPAPPEPDVIEPVSSVEIPAWLALDMANSSIFESGKRRDIILETYRDPNFRDEVIAFFSLIADSRLLASIILAQAEAYNVSPALAFALCKEESQFTVRAINRKNVNGSIDRGLFQLNNRSFPQLKEADFFNPETNTQQGMAHLRWCLDTAGSELAALAMYNAGATKVKSNNTPKRTLDYISRILDSRDRIEEAFRVEYLLNEDFHTPHDPATPAAEKRAELVQIAFFPYR
ncbi:transglycosylase SLT domain-containing protein [Treponema sp. TIM-1]|uniref:transglycosylase SLT domain-containing protein n=1 Tax=Treponema sp. TIM-1 TaxID=2898417 RepID=UPI003980CAFC